MKRFACLLLLALCALLLCSCSIDNPILSGDYISPDGSERMNIDMDQREATLVFSDDFQAEVSWMSEGNSYAVMYRTINGITYRFVVQLASLGDEGTGTVVCTDANNNVVLGSVDYSVSESNGTKTLLVSLKLSNDQSCVLQFAQGEDGTFATVELSGEAHSFAYVPEMIPVAGKTYIHVSEDLTMMISFGKDGTVLATMLAGPELHNIEGTYEQDGSTVNVYANNVLEVFILNADGTELSVADTPSIILQAQ